MRTAILLLLATLLAAALLFLWPEVERAAQGTPGADATPAAAPAAGSLSADPGLRSQPERSNLTGTLLVRVLDAAGRATAGTVYANVDGTAVRLEAKAGLLEIPPPVLHLEAAAEAAGAWSERASWSAEENGARELVLRLEAEAISAPLRLRVRVQDDGPASAPAARLALAARRGGLIEMFEGMEYREDLIATIEEERAARPVPGETAAAARARLQRSALRESRWEGADGEIEITGLLPGSWIFEVAQDGCAPETVEVEVPEGAPQTAEVLLARAGSAAGRVVDASGRPVAGARVALWHKPAKEMPMFDALEEFRRYGRIPRGVPEHHRALTAADGSFRMSVAKPGAYLPIAVADGFLPTVGQEIEVQPRQLADAGALRLGAGHELLARVRARDGSPVADAKVRWRAGESVMASMTAGSKAVLTDAQGEARLTALPDGTLEFEAQKAGFAIAHESLNVGAELLQPAVWEPVLQPGAMLAGTVLAGGQAVAGALVRGGPPPSGNEIIPVRAAAADSARSAVDGSFRLENLPIGPCRITVDHPDHAAWVSDALDLQPGENPPLVVALSVGGTIRVQVQDEGGGPVAQAPVVAIQAATQATARAETGADGLAVLAHLRPGTWQVLRMQMNDPQALENLDLSMRFSYVELQEGEVVDLLIGGPTLVATVEGRVSSGGAPLPGKTLVLMSGSGIKSATTNADGLYKLEKVPVGEHVLMVTGGFGGGASWSGALTVPAAGTLRHDLEMPSSVVEIHVVDGGSGEPVAGVPVNLRPEDESSLSGGMMQKTNDDGIARYEMMGPGTYLAAIGNLAMPMLGGGEGRGSTILRGIVVASADGGLQRAEARLPAPASLRVRVTGPDGAVVAGAHVFCVDQDGHPLNVISMKGTNAKGVLELAGLPPGPAHFVVRHSQIGRAEFDAVMQAGSVVKQEVRLTAGVHLLVSVVDEKGAPATGVLVVVYDAAGRPVNTMFTMEDSQAIQQSWFGGTAQRIGPLMPGTYTVLLNRPGHPAVRHAATVAATPAEQPLRLRLAAD